MCMYFYMCVYICRSPTPGQNSICYFRPDYRQAQSLDLTVLMERKLLIHTKFDAYLVNFRHLVKE